MTFHILGMSSSQLTNSYFSEGLKRTNQNVFFSFNGDKLPVYWVFNGILLGFSGFLTMKN